MDLSASFLLSNLLIGSLGAAFFLYGKKAARPWPLVVGLAMCIYPFFITNLTLLWLLTAALCVALYLLREGSSVL